MNSFTHGTLRGMLLGSSALIVAALPAAAQDATWLLNPGSGDFDTAANWTPATVPTGTATFGTSNTTALSFSTNTTVGGWTFNAAASNYTFANGGILGFTGAGIVITGGSATIANSLTMLFDNASTAGSAIINNNTTNSEIGFFNTSTAGSSTITNSNGALVSFVDSSTAGSATITNTIAGSIISFVNTSTAGSATITNNAASVEFGNTSTAGNATITNTNGLIAFADASTAGSATITNDGTITFSNTSTAGTASITNNVSVDFNDASTAGGASFTNNNTIIFANTSTAGGATIANNNNGDIIFRNTSTAGTAAITNNTGAVINFEDSSTAGSAALVNNAGINFLNTSTAGSATITNNTGAIIDFNNTSTAGSASFTNNLGGTLDFQNTSTAANAIINNNSIGGVAFSDTATAGSATIANINGGSTQFFDSSTAGSAGITNNNGSRTTFFDTSTAGNATITTNNGGNVLFVNSATGGNARFITNAGGVFDMSQLTSGGMTAGSIEGAGSYFLGANALTVGSNGLSTTVSGVISDGGAAGGIGGALTKVGPGTLTLSAINTYTGATNVNGGALVVNGSTATSSLTVVNSGGTLAGIGAVGNTSVAAGGTFMPGSGAPGSSMTVTGNLNLASGSFYAVALNPAVSSSANVSGTATLAGATVNASFAPGSYAFKQYTIVQAGSVSGTFAPTVVNSNLPSNFADTLSYDATHAFLNLVLAPVAGPLNINQTNVDNGVLNSFNVTGGIPAVFGSLTPAALTQLSGEVGASFRQAAFQAGNSFVNMMLNPFLHGQANGSGAGVGAIGYAPERPQVATSAFASVDRKQDPAIDPHYTFWGGAYGGSGSIDGNATTGSHDTSSQVYGLAAGLDYRATPDTTLGFALGGGGTHWSLDQNLGSGRSDMFQAGLYGRTLWGSAYLAGALAYSFHEVTTNRTVTLAGTDMLQADFNANVFSGRLEGGYRYALPWAGVTPYGAVQVQSLVLPSYNESATSGSNQFALSYASQAPTTTRTELGARFDKTWTLNNDTLLTLYSRLAWAHDFGNTPSASAIFQALPASNFTVFGARPAPDGALITAGAEYKLGNGWSVLAKFDGEFSSTTALYSGSGTIRKVW
ncbi:MAG TPA: autotransporter domain-containing protein [Xanthobacteraceae bacterium]